MSCEQAPVPILYNIGIDDWGNDLYQTDDDFYGKYINGKKRTFVMVDNKIHTMSKDEEPEYPVSWNYKIKKEIK